MRRSLKAKMGSLSIKNKKASATFQNRKGSWLLTVHFLPPLASHKTRSLINDGGGNYENTNITGKRAVNHPKTQLNDALMESCGHWERKRRPFRVEGEPAYRQTSTFRTRVIMKTGVT